VRFTEEALDLTLLPVWIFAVHQGSGKPTVRFVVNGQTGKVHGSAPVSWAKVAAIAAAILGLIGVVAVLWGVL
jgi:hypothetical protein